MFSVTDLLFCGVTIHLFRSEVNTETPTVDTEKRDQTFHLLNVTLLTTDSRVEILKF